MRKRNEKWWFWCKRDAKELGKQVRINTFSCSHSFLMRVLSFFSGAVIHVQTLLMSAHVTVILVAMVNLAMIAELYNTTEISHISIWQYRNIC